jgi:hypothetical protein
MNGQNSDQALQETLEKIKAKQAEASETSTGSSTGASVPTDKK